MKAITAFLCLLLFVLPVLAQKEKDQQDDGQQGNVRVFSQKQPTVTGYSAGAEAEFYFTQATTSPSEYQTVPDMTLQITAAKTGTVFISGFVNSGAYDDKLKNVSIFIDGNQVSDYGDQGLSYLGPITAGKHTIEVKALIPSGCDTDHCGHATNRVINAIVF